MEPNPHIQVCYQTLLAYLTLVFVFFCFILTWWMFHLDAKRFIMRPGINIKEL